MRSFDVIIIGGGFLGLSTAYQLSKIGVKTLLLEAGDIGSGTSASCSGRAQTCEGHLDALNIQIIRDGLSRHETLEEELGQQYDWRKTGILLLIKSQKLWNHWEERAAILSPAGIPTEVIDQKALQSAEPSMQSDHLLGAAYAIEGMLDPLKFSLAYANAARRHGAVILGRSKVTGFDVKNNRIVAVKTRTGSFTADKIAVMAGAWTSKVTELAGVQVPVLHTHAEALVTEKIAPIVHNNIELADFYETIHGKKRAVAIGIHPQPNGTLDISEAVTATDQLHKGLSAWGITKMCSELVSLFPTLADVKIVRTWGRPTSFTPDEEPLIGWVPNLENLFVATSLVITITTVPLLSEWMAFMLKGEAPPVSLDEYSPARFSQAIAI